MSKSRNSRVENEISRQEAYERSLSDEQREKIQKDAMRLLRRNKRERRAKERLKPKTLGRPKSDRPRGRPAIDPKRLDHARRLAETRPISTVAIKTGISTSTLYSYGISRRAVIKTAEQKRDRGSTGNY